MSHLFSNQSLSDYFDEINDKIIQHIDSISEDQFIASSDEKIIEHVLSIYEITAIEIHDDKMVAESKEDKLRYSGYGHVEEVDGIHFTVELPFTGDSRLWHLQPSTWRTSFPQGSLQCKKDGQEILAVDISVALSQDPATSNNLIKKNIADIKFYLEQQKKDIEQFNRTIPGISKSAINRKRSKLGKKNKVLEAFEIPLKKTADAPDMKPICIQRKLVKPLPSVPTASKEPEYEISDKDYEHILNVIRHEGATFESTPETYKGMGEEDLRNITLAHLNGHYEGDATGETFRNEGKTDIRIEFDNRAAFVAECKIWHGEKNVTDAIDQMLGYLTWRDCRTSMIVFNKDVAGFKGIQDKIPNIFENHKQYVQALQSSHAGEWRYVLKSSDDEKRKITVHVFLFNLYVG